jgi:hypothetical protein
VLTRPISAIITLAVILTFGITFVVSLCIILQFFLLLFEVIAIFVLIVEPAICCLLLVILVVVNDVPPCRCHSATTEAPINQVLTDEDDALDALVRGTLLLACVVYDEALLIGQEGSRAGQ